MAHSAGENSQQPKPSTHAPDGSPGAGGARKPEEHASAPSMGRKEEPMISQEPRSPNRERLGPNSRGTPDVINPPDEDT